MKEDDCVQVEGLFYTYIDECKQNYLTQIMRDKNIEVFQEYSITSLTFHQSTYQEKLEKEWKNFREKYKFDSTKALHFVEFRKLLVEEERNSSNSMYKYFLIDDEFSVDTLKSFFKGLLVLIQENEFMIVHTDYYWKKGNYLVKRNKFNSLQMKNSLSRNIAPNILNAIPYVAMRKHLDSLLMTLLKRYVSGESIPSARYFDEEIPKKMYTKLRFDADGREFDARTDLKKAYNHTVAIGSDNVQQKVAIEMLDEIRFIRKEEVGSEYIPSHCGLEIVDFLCSMIAGETRLKEYKTKYTALADVESGTFLNIRFEDGEVISFYDIVMEKICRKTMNYLDYEQ